MSHTQALKQTVIYTIHSSGSSKENSMVAEEYECGIMIGVMSGACR